MNQIRLAIERVGNFRLHPLGFFYLSDMQGHGINQRVHVWTATSEWKNENACHQHTFDIHSRVVMGRMRSELFRFVESPDGYEQEFKVTYNNGESRLSATGRAGILENVATFESIEGSEYFLSAGEIHRVTVVEAPCVTVLRTRDRDIPIFSYGRDAEEAPFERRPVTEMESKEIARVLQQVTYM